MSSATPAPHVYTLTPEDKAVDIISAIAGFVSLLLVAGLLAYLVALRFVPSLRYTETLPTQQWRQTHALITCLFAANLVQALSGTIQARWAARGRVDTGAFCTAQSVFLLSGDVGVAIWNGAVAAHTFTTIALRRTWNDATVAVLIALGWGVTLAMPFIGRYAVQEASKGSIYGISHSWCFIANQDGIPRLYLHYFPILVSAGVILIAYFLIFLCVRGTLELHQWPPRILTRVPKPAPGAAHAMPAVAQRMLWYPASFLLVFLTITVARIASQAHDKVPRWVWDMGVVLLYSSGAVNALIYSSTRRALSPVSWARRGSAQPLRASADSDRKRSGSIVPEPVVPGRTLADYL